jgi:hypothetical protein
VVPLFSCGMNSSNRPIAQSSISSICKHLRPQNANGRKSRPRPYLSPLPRLQRNPAPERSTFAIPTWNIEIQTRVLIRRDWAD